MAPLSILPYAPGANLEVLTLGNVRIVVNHEKQLALGRARKAVKELVALGDSLCHGNLESIAKARAAYQNAILRIAYEKTQGHYISDTEALVGLDIVIDEEIRQSSPEMVAYRAAMNKPPTYSLNANVDDDPVLRAYRAHTVDPESVRAHNARMADIVSPPPAHGWSRFFCGAPPRVAY